MPLSPEERAKRQALISKLEINPMDATQLPAIVETYGAMVAKLEKALEKKDGPSRDTVVSEIAQGAAGSTFVADVTNTLAKTVFAPDVSDGEYVLLLDAINEIAANVRRMVDAAVEQKLHDGRKAKSPRKVEAMKDEASTLRAILVDSITMAVDNGYVSADQFPYEDRKNRSGGTAPVLALPIVPGTRGRPASESNGVTHKMSYSVDGESVDDGTLLSTIATQWLSSPEHVVTRQEIVRLVKEAGHSFSDEAWSVKINGHLLVAKRVEA